MVAAIFLPQQRQRYAAAAQLRMDMSPIRKRLRSRRIVPGWRKELALQRRVVDLLRYRPADANHRGATDILRNRRATNPDRPGDHPIARPTGILQAKNFSNLPHRQSLGGHRTSHCVNRKRRTLPRSDCRQCPPSHPINRGGRLRSDSANSSAALSNSRLGGEEMRAARLKELEELAAKLLETARKLPSGQDHWQRKDPQGSGSGGSDAWYGRRCSRQSGRPAGSCAAFTWLCRGVSPFRTSCA